MSDGKCTRKIVINHWDIIFYAMVEKHSAYHHNTQNSSLSVDDLSEKRSCLNDENNLVFYHHKKYVEK